EGAGGEGIDSLLVGGERKRRRKKGVCGPLRAGEREGGGCGWDGATPWSELSVCHSSFPMT
ncbi:hypothetical protein MUK42_30183, partial [Musa troglodytarum]